MAGTSPAQKLILKARQQVDGIKAAFAAQEINILTVDTLDGGVSFMCPTNQILVRDNYLEHVERILGQKTPKVQPVTAGVVLLTLDPADLNNKVPLDGREPVVAAVDAVDQGLGQGIATPNHVLTVCDGIVSPCPATEPRVVDDLIEPYPGIRPGNGGSGVLIYVADTGLLAGADTAYSWLAGVQAGADGYEADLRPRGFIEPYTGHGTFVAGVARCIAPQADVVVSNVFKVAGSTLESDFVADLTEALKLGVDIFNLSIAAPSRNDLPLLAFEGWLTLLSQYKGVVCVVAAGNSAVRSPTWPAAFAQVVSVGALTVDGRDRADFSNYGGWVDVYAPGRNIINAYTSGKYQYQDAPYKGQPPVEFYGMARWSGTSFSTPIVTGLIAARMSRTGEDGREAAAALLRQARANAIPGVGAILLPTDAESW
jgi:subtilisin family serine protease